jgi:SAM-dependent methyltransferase
MTIQEQGRRVFRAVRRLVHNAEDTLLRPKGAQQIEREAQKFWSVQSEHKGQMAHWRGAGVFSDVDLWSALGKEHLELYERFARAEGKTSLRRVVEWGAGGGANAVHFAPRAQEFVAVDIAADTLAECGKQVAALNGSFAFKPVLIGTSEPEAALAQIGGSCDLFLSTYVFELLPSPEYGLRVLNCARQLLEPGGLALIQIKYRPNARVRRRARYERDFANFTSYEIEEFWSEAEKCGLLPRAITLVPDQQLVQDRNYAYFLLKKP